MKRGRSYAVEAFIERRVSGPTVAVVVSGPHVTERRCVDDFDFFDRDGKRRNLSKRRPHRTDGMA